MFFFYLIELLFSGFLPFKGSFLCGQNNSKYRDWSPLSSSFVVTADKNVSCAFFFQFLVAEHGSVQKEKVTEDYNDAYPLKVRKDDYEINIYIYRF